MAGKATEAVNEASFEINLAQRVVARFNLSPPVDAAIVVERYADLEYCTIPFRVDGICLDLKRIGKRPTIIINVDQPSRRRRFTLAHELGHVLIPWHRGSVYDDFSIVDTSAQFDRREMEGEAN
jgi:IrrE N-terminal-like domain